MKRMLSTIAAAALLSLALTGCATRCDPNATWESDLGTYADSKCTWEGKRA